MLNKIEGLPGGVVGFEAVGEVTGDDYESAMVPAVDEVLKTYDKIRFLYVLGDEFGGYSASAMWDDAKIGMNHWGSWERIALVTDNGTYQGMVKALGILMPGRVKVFENAQLDEAKAWVSEDDDG